MANKSPSPMFKPTLILHGGAGDIQRSTLPPDLYEKYHASLLSYLRSTKDLLHDGAAALDAATHAVSLMEDDELFNCGRGSVFTSAGTIEMEASVMVTSVRHHDDESQASMKRGAGVMGLRNVKHPIRLARESLLRTGCDADGKPNGDGGGMHMQLVAPYVEERAKEWGLEIMPDEWFWTEKRWEEHRRGLEGKNKCEGGAGEEEDQELISMSQGTVGCVCLDQWGNLAVATSTGGVTNKWPGRIGDTPTMGSGFWTEAWDVDYPSSSREDEEEDVPDEQEALISPTSPSSPTWGFKNIRSLFSECTPSFINKTKSAYTSIPSANPDSQQNPDDDEKGYSDEVESHIRTTRRAVALSGTGNGDSFLRIAAARTASAMARFAPPVSSTTLAQAITAIAGPGGELQSSAGKRWGTTREGEGGIIGIEAEAEVDTESQGHKLRYGKVAFDFNCGGMWRAWVEENEYAGETERVMVFRDEYR